MLLTHDIELISLIAFDHFLSVKYEQKRNKKKEKLVLESFNLTLDDFTNQVKEKIKYYQDKIRHALAEIYGKDYAKNEEFKNAELATFSIITRYDGVFKDVSLEIYINRIFRFYLERKQNKFKGAFGQFEKDFDSDDLKDLLNKDDDDVFKFFTEDEKTEFIILVKNELLLFSTIFSRKLLKDEEIKVTRTALGHFLSFKDDVKVIKNKAKPKKVMNGEIKSLTTEAFEFFSRLNIEIDNEFPESGDENVDILKKEYCYQIVVEKIKELIKSKNICTKQVTKDNKNVKLNEDFFLIKLVKIFDEANKVYDDGLLGKKIKIIDKYKSAIKEATEEIYNIFLEIFYLKVERLEGFKLIKTIKSFIKDKLISAYIKHDDNTATINRTSDWTSIAVDVAKIISELVDDLNIIDKDIIIEGNPIIFSYIDKVIRRKDSYYFDEAKGKERIEACLKDNIIKKDSDKSLKKLQQELQDKVIREVLRFQKMLKRSLQDKEILDFVNYLTENNVNKGSVKGNTVTKKIFTEEALTKNLSEEAMNVLNNIPSVSGNCPKETLISDIQEQLSYLEKALKRTMNDGERVNIFEYCFHKLLKEKYSSIFSKLKKLYEKEEPDFNYDSEVLVVEEDEEGFDTSIYYNTLLGFDLELTGDSGDEELDKRAKEIAKADSEEEEEAWSAKFKDFGRDEDVEELFREDKAILKRDKEVEELLFKDNNNPESDSSSEVQPIPLIPRKSHNRKRERKNGDVEKTNIKRKKWWWRTREWRK